MHIDTGLPRNSPEKLAPREVPRNGYIHSLVIPGLADSSLRAITCRGT